MQLGSPGIFCVYFRGVAFMNSALTRPGAAAWRVHLAATCVALLLLLILAFCAVAMSPLITDTCGLLHEIRPYALICVPAAIVVIASASPYVKGRYFSDSANVFFASLLVQGAWLFALALGLSGSFALPAFLEVLPPLAWRSRANLAPGVHGALALVADGPAWRIQLCAKTRGPEQGMAALALGR
ncbi:MAG: hypothetical protein IPN40_12775 [Uliginosibacterium sp.]|nr:hypothetical protein [Uliginosibacterium sp.]